ncbi:hypothetical protein B0H14DRAFT_2597356 [Mycena olivaceomarginata]|nr:hypothetical protein B0H14DRAFT_2597356 [Mycena olivaceomarginata]
MQTDQVGNGREPDEKEDLENDKQESLAKNPVSIDEKNEYIKHYGEGGAAGWFLTGVYTRMKYNHSTGRSGIMLVRCRGYSTHNPVGTAINRQGPLEKPWPSRRHLIHNAVGAGNECGVPGYTTQNPVGAAINRQGPLDRNCGHSGNECGVAGYSTHNPVGAVINQQGPLKTETQPFRQ